MSWSRLIFAGLAALAVAAGPPPSGRTFDGRPFAIGQAPVSVVHYWAHWCAPCRAEMPKLDAWYRANRARGVSLVAISLDRGGRSAMKDMAGMAMPGARIEDVRIARRDIPTALPQTLVYNRSGQLLYDSRKQNPEGSIDFAMLSRAVDAGLRSAAAAR